MKKIIFIMVAAASIISTDIAAQSKKISELERAGLLTDTDIDSSDVVANVGNTTYRVRGFNYRHVTGLQEAIEKNGVYNQHLYISSNNGKAQYWTINNGNSNAHFYNTIQGYQTDAFDYTTYSQGNTAFTHSTYSVAITAHSDTATGIDGSRAFSRLYYGKTDGTFNGFYAMPGGRPRIYTGTTSNYFDYPLTTPSAGKSWRFTNAHDLELFTPLSTEDRDTLNHDPSLDFTTVGNTTTAAVNLAYVDSAITGYREYTCTLTDYGNDPITSGNLHPWETYTITSYSSGDDFSAVASVVSGTINTTGCVFVANGTTPTDWSHGSTLTPAGNPIPRVLKNTLGIAPKFTRVGGYTGHYLVTDNGGGFTIGNTTVEIGTRVGDGTLDYHFATNVDNSGDNYHLYIHTYSSDGTDATLVTRNDSYQLLENTYYSIKVYY